MTAAQVANIYSNVNKYNAFTRTDRRTAMWEYTYRADMWIILQRGDNKTYPPANFSGIVQVDLVWVIYISHTAKIKVFNGMKTIRS